MLLTEKFTSPVATLATRNVASMLVLAPVAVHRVIAVGASLSFNAGKQRPASKQHSDRGKGDGRSERHVRDVDQHPGRQHTDRAQNGDHSPQPDREAARRDAVLRAQPREPLPVGACGVHVLERLEQPHPHGVHPTSSIVTKPGTPSRPSLLSSMKRRTHRGTTLAQAEGSGRRSGTLSRIHE